MINQQGISARNFSFWTILRKSHKFFKRISARHMTIKKPFLSVFPYKSLYSPRGGRFYLRESGCACVLRVCECVCLNYPQKWQVAIDKCINRLLWAVAMLFPH